MQRRVRKGAGRRGGNRPVYREIPWMVPLEKRSPMEIRTDERVELFELQQELERERRFL